MRFPNLDHLMAFAFSAGRAISLSAIYAMARDKDRTRRRRDPISKQDVAAQRGLIQSYVRRQPGVGRWHFTALYGRAQYRSEAQNRLTDYVLARLPTDAHKRRLIYEMVARYYGKTVILKGVAKRFEIPYADVLIAWARVDGMLEDLDAKLSADALDHYRAEDLIE